MDQDGEDRKQVEDEIMSRYVEGMLHNSKNHLVEAEASFKRAYQLAKDLYKEAQESIRFYEEAWKSAQDKLQQEKAARATSEAKQAEEKKETGSSVRDSTLYHPTGEARNQARRSSMQLAMFHRRSALDSMSERRKNKARIVIQKLINSTLHHALSEWHKAAKSSSKAEAKDGGGTTDDGE